MPLGSYRDVLGFHYREVKLGPALLDSSNGPMLTLDHEKIRSDRSIELGHAYSPNQFSNQTC